MRLASPPWVLRAIHMSLGMGHKPENSPGWIAKSRNITHRTVGICGIRNGTRITFGLRCLVARRIAHYKLPITLQLGEDLRILHNELSLSMCYRQFNFADALQEHAIPWFDLEPYPARLESARIVERQRCRRIPISRGTKKLCLHENLETVTNNNNQFSGGAKFFQSAGQMMLQLAAQYSSRCN